MPIPVTFSPPGDSFEPSIEDALQFGVWLMFRADDVMRKRYSYDDVAMDGNKIVQESHAIKDTEKRLVLPQLIIGTPVGGSRWVYKTSQTCEKLASVAISHLFVYDTSYADMDQDDLTAALSANPTANMVLARSEQILQLGTLYRNAWHEYIDEPVPTSNKGMVVNHFASPLFTADDAPHPSLINTYDPARAKMLTSGPPDEMVRFGDVIWSRRPPKKDEDIDPVRDFAVLYSLKATYQIDMSDREQPTHGGELG